MEDSLTYALQKLTSSAGETRSIAEKADKFGGRNVEHR